MATILERARQFTPSGCQTYSKRRMPPPLDTAFANHAVNCWIWPEGQDDFGIVPPYLDFSGGLGAIILGYRYPDVEAAVRRQLDKGVGFSLPTRLEGDLAERLADLIPCAEQTRFLKNGADPLEAAVRIARAVQPARPNVLRCGYHGMHDWCVESRGIFGNAKHNGGDIFRTTFAVPYGNLSALEEAIDEHSPCVFVLEPFIAQNPVWPPSGYLQQVRRLVDQHGMLLVFDETVTGFRLPKLSAQALFGVTPDLATFSKALGNGYSISALCGKRALMQEIERGVFVSTTFGGDPVGLAAALATVRVLVDENVVHKLWTMGSELAADYATGASVVSINTTLVGYPLRWVSQFAIREQETAFNTTMAQHGVIAPGSYNLMYAHYLQQEEVWDQLHRAWAAAFLAARNAA